MAYHPKLNVYIITLKPKNEGEKSTVRDFLQEKYFLPEHTPDKELLRKLFEDFVNLVGQNEYYIDDKNKKVIGIDDGGILPLCLSSEQWIIDGVIEGGKYGILREYADKGIKMKKMIILPTNAVLDKYYILLNPILNDSYAILLVQSYSEESIQGSVNTLVNKLFGSSASFHKAKMEPFVPKRLKERYLANAVVRMFSFTTPLPLSEDLREAIPEANQEFEVEVRIKPKRMAMSVDSQGTQDVIDAFGTKMVDGRVLSEGKGRVFMTDASDRNANYEIEKGLASIRPTIYLLDEDVDTDPETGRPNFNMIKEFSRGLLPEIKRERDINLDIDEH